MLIQGQQRKASEADRSNSEVKRDRPDSEVKGDEVPPLPLTLAKQASSIPSALGKRTAEPVNLAETKTPSTQESGLHKRQKNSSETKDELKESIE